jgi:hypothetical protein
MNFLQKIQRAFSQGKDEKLLNEIKKLTAQKAIAKKDSFYKTRVFYAEKHIKDWKDAINEATSYPYYRKTNLYELIEQIRYDGQIKAQVRTRKNGTLAEPFLIDADNETKKIIKKIIDVILDSLLFWASACEVNQEGVFVVKPEYLCIEKNELVIGYEQGVPFSCFEDLLVFKNPFDDLGELTFAAQYAIYKRFSLTDWSRHSELFGMPFLSLRTPTTDPVELKKKHNALSNFGSAAYVILDTDEELSAIDTKNTTSPHEIYLEMIKFCDEQISKIIAGQTGTADTKAFVGSAEVHERILDWYVEFDMLHVQETINHQVLPFLERKGLVKKGAIFEFSYFKEKREASAKKIISKQEGETSAQQHSHNHIESDYESYLLSLKKKC